MELVNGLRLELLQR